MYSALNKGYRRNRKRANVTSRLSRALYRQRSSRGTVVAAARSLNTAARGLQLAQGEFKSVDATGTINADTTGAILLLNGIARGDEISERNGREVVMKSIQLRYTHAVGAASGIDQTHRLLIVYDRQTNAAALTVAQVLTAATILSPKNLENRRRFTILLDRMIDLGAVAETDSRRTFEFYRKLNHPITFNSGDAGTVADITTGSMYAVVMGTIAAGATAGNCYMSSRIRYQDK